MKVKNALPKKKKNFNLEKLLLSRKPIKKLILKKF